MKKQKIIIVLGICGALILGGCVAPKENAKTETPAVESNQDADREGVNAFPVISGEGVKKVETAFPDENQSYAIYEGIDKEMREGFKESLMDHGFGDWMVMEDEEDSLVYETAMTETEQATLVYPVSENGQLQVFLIENIDELIEESK